MNKLILLVCTVLMAGCTATTKEELTESGLKRSDFQTEVNGEKTDLFVLKNKNKMEVCVTNFGGRIVSVMVPDKDGNMKDVVLGFDSIQDYIKYPSDFGASIGRYANRINQGRFTLDGVEYQLPQNNYGHCLHGGPKGFQYRVYKGVQKSDQELQLTYLAKDGEEGFPGNLQCTVIMKLTDDNAIDIQYEAETDKPTIINMTNHSYFNLDGDPSTDNSAYLLTLNADSYTPVDSTFMTTGEIVTVEGTPMDFRTAKQIGQDIEAEFDQLKFTGGYDHNYVTDNYAKGNRRLIATAYSDKTGIAMDVTSDCPCVQFYAANFVENEYGKNGHTYNKRDAFCLETQVEPNAVNVEDFHSPILNAGEQYDSVTAYHFYIRK